MSIRANDMAGEIYARIFQSWQVETANVLPLSVTRLNFGQIEFILLYLVTRLCFES